MRRWKRRQGGWLLLPMLLAALVIMPLKPEAAAYECTARVPVSVEATGESGETFTVRMEPGSGMGEEIPMPEETELQLTGGTEGAFEGIRFTEPGDYVYTVRQAAGNTEYMRYDETVYTVVIQVTNGEDGGLTYQVFASRDESPEEKTGEIRFVNTYEPPAESASTEAETTAPETQTESPSETEEVTQTVPKTGDAQNLLPFAAVLAVAAGVVAVLGIWKSRSSREDGHSGEQQ